MLEAEVKVADDAPTLVKAFLAAGRPAAIEAGWVGGELAGLAVVSDGEAAEVAWIPVEAVASLDGDLSALPFHAHNAKPLLRELTRHDIDLRGLDIDTALAAYLIDPADSRYSLEELLLRYCRMELPAGDGDEGQLALEDDVEPIDVSLIAARRALAVDRLATALAKALGDRGLQRLYDDIERPLVRVLAKMEDRGVAVDVVELTELRDSLVSECDRLEQGIKDHAGEDFNVNSTKQLREILFEKLELTPQKKTKTGYSTDAASLERIRDQHPIVEDLLAYREVEKLRSTYGQGLLDVVEPDDRIHATFNQTVARTGRLSSEDPNLHNIPVRTDVGRVFRKAFVPGDGYELLVADYNQIELRVIAHLSGDPGLVDAFESGTDIHNATAAQVFGVDQSDVSIEQRSKAKMVSYGLAYGMESYGLSQRLNIPIEEAAEILEAYFTAFPKVKSFMEDVVAETRERGYTETMFGRRRPIPELSASNYRVRQAAERQAMNAPIQGLAADIFKVALVRLDGALEEGDYESALILQVHDEVILEMAPKEHDVVADLTVDTMKNAAELRVPLEVHITSGKTWADAKG